MANTVTYFNFKSGVGNHASTLHTSEDYMNVYASISLGKVGTWGGKSIFNLELQRKVNGYWQTIDYAYNVPAESAYPGHVTFYDIGKRGLPMRIKLFWDQSYVVYSNAWGR